MMISLCNFSIIISPSHLSAYCRLSHASSSSSSVVTKILVLGGATRTMSATMPIDDFTSKSSAMRSRRSGVRVMKFGCTSSTGRKGGVLMSGFICAMAGELIRGIDRGTGTALDSAAGRGRATTSALDEEPDTSGGKV